MLWLQQKKTISVDKHIAEKLKLITWSVGCSGWVFCLILICWGGGDGAHLFSLWGPSQLFLPDWSLIHRHNINRGNDRRTQVFKASQLHKGSVDVLQKSEKLWTTKKFHFPKYFLDHILSTSPRFIFYSVHPTASQSVISLKSLFTYWSREQLVEHLSIISDKHT